MRSILALCLALLVSVYACAQDGLVLATIEWEPYVGSSVRDNGFVADVVRAALAAGGRGEPEARVLPWTRALKGTLSGKNAGVFPLYFTEERARIFHLSEPIPGGPLVLMKRADAPVDYSGKVTELRPYRIGVVTGYSNTPEFDAAAYLKKDAGPSDLANLKKLIHGRLDLIVIDRLVAERMLSRPELAKYRNEVEPVDPPLAIKPLYVAFSRAHPQGRAARDAFNTGLKTITENGTLKAVFERHGVGHVFAEQLQAQEPAAETPAPKAEAPKEEPVAETAEPAAAEAEPAGESYPDLPPVEADWDAPAMPEAEYERGVVMRFPRLPAELARQRAFYIELVYAAMKKTEDDFLYDYEKAAPSKAEYPTAAAQIAALGTADVEVVWYTANEKLQREFKAVQIPLADLGGPADRYLYFHKRESALAGQVKDALALMAKDGELKPIFEKYKAGF